MIEGFSSSGQNNIYVKDLLSDHPIVMASWSPDGSSGANGSCANPSATLNLVFETKASNLAPNGVDQNDATDIYRATPQLVSFANVIDMASEDAPTATLSLTRNSPTGSLTVRVRPRAGSATTTATVGVDFDGADATFAAGSLNAQVELPIFEDYLVEGNEEVELEVVVTGGYAFGNALTTTLVIADNDFDSDGDGINDDTDNCPNDANTNQLDSDADGFGNVCDMTEGLCNNAIDDDNDGLVDCDDSECANDSSCGQQADEDEESDGVPNVNDNCPNVANPTQLDTDADGVGNACDLHEGSCGNFLDDDLDGDVDCDDSDCANDIACAAPLADDDNDGAPNGSDNCPNTPNPLQSDTDSDNIGDLCDNDEGVCNDGLDNDNDGLVDCDDENCDKDSVCEKPDLDFDSDGWDNSVDNCPYVDNADQADGDGDGVGDLCDTKEDACANGLDDDNDGDVDCDDAQCAAAFACADPEGDVDEDGAPNDSDNCPNVDNPDQLDSDEDGIGDACDTTPEGAPMLPEPPKPEEDDDAVPGDDTVDCSCSLPGRGRSDDAPWILLLGAALPLWLRRRRRGARGTLTASAR